MGPKVPRVSPPRGTLYPELYVVAKLPREIISPDRSLPNARHDQAESYNIDYEILISKSFTVAQRSLYFPS